MKREQQLKFGILLLLLLLLSSSGMKARKLNDDAKSWFKQKEWLKGLKLQPHQSTDILEFSKQYRSNKAGWDKAFAFMRDSNLDSLKAGKYKIDGENVFADVTNNPSSELKDAKWHSHRQYCDIIFIIKGKEKIGIAPIKGVPIKIPFNEGDSQFYNQDMRGKYYVSNPDTFFILFPSDVHRPFIKVDGYDYVKRIRFKIKTR